MPQNPDKIEQMCLALEVNDNRVTKDGIEARIKQVDYQVIELCGHKFMYCGIEMDNGFVVVGKPATCIDPANWRDEIGKQVSYDNTFSEIWRLEAYRKMAGA